MSFFIYTWVSCAFFIAFSNIFCNLHQSFRGLGQAITLLLAGLWDTFGFIPINPELHTLSGSPDLQIIGFGIIILCAISLIRLCTSSFPIPPYSDCVSFVSIKYGSLPYFFCSCVCMEVPRFSGSSTFSIPGSPCCCLPLVMALVMEPQTELRPNTSQIVRPYPFAVRIGLIAPRSFFGNILLLAVVHKQPVGFLAEYALRCCKFLSDRIWNLIL